MAAGKVRQVVSEGRAAELLAFSSQIVHAVAVKLGRRTVQRQGDIGAQFIARLAHRFSNDLQGSLIGRQVGGKAALVSNSGTQAAGGQYFLQLVKDFRTGPQALCETWPHPPAAP